ncbi:MAG TPA: hypothetical protein QF700_03955, partial [Prochlorococcus sp.]|nr:hypothetical protein [Prochlorococcus sp.]
IELIYAKGRGAANDGPGVMRNYTSKYLAELKLGGVGRKRALLDVSRFLLFAVTKCGAAQNWLPIEGDDLQDLIGLAETRKKDKVPVTPELAIRPNRQLVRQTRTTSCRHLGWSIRTKTSRAESDAR